MDTVLPRVPCNRTALTNGTILARYFECTRGAWNIDTGFMSERRNTLRYLGVGPTCSGG